MVAALACYSSGHIYAGINVNHDQTTSGYVYHSSDNGDTWPDTVLVGSAISSLAAGPTGLMYAGTTEDGVFRSSDYGKTWTPVNTGLADTPIGPVITLVSEKLNPGLHKYQWQADNLPSGIYYSRLKAGEFEQVRKMILLR